SPPHQISGHSLAPIFFPPELSIQSEMEDIGGADLGGKTDLLRRLYFKRLHSTTTANGRLDRQLVSLVLDHARRVIAHPSRPVVRRIEPFVAFPHSELALEETI